jgi:hypothetical protein
MVVHEVGGDPVQVVLAVIVALERRCGAQQPV